MAISFPLSHNKTVLLILNYFEISKGSVGFVKFRHAVLFYVTVMMGCLADCRRYYLMSQ